MYSVRQDVAYAIRQMGRSPWLTFVATMSLALGIGATTTTFTILNSVVWKQLPVPAPDQLVKIQTVDSSTGRIHGIPASLLKDLNHASVFTGVIAGINDGISFRAGEITERVMGEAVTANFFHVLGVQPFIGRYFSTDVNGTAWRAEAVLSYEFFGRRFGGDPGIVGQTIRLNGYPFTVIGVSPPGFFGVEVGSSWEVRVPMMTEPGMQARLVPTMRLLDPRSEGFVSPLARLKPGVSRQQAEAATNVLFQQLFASDPEVQRRGYGKSHVRVEDGSRGASRLGTQFVRTLSIVMALAGVLLLIACANVSNLLLARATARKREMAIRLAIGASRGRLVRQLLTEGLLLAAFGGAMGLCLAYWGAGMLLRFLPQGSIPIVLEFEVDTRVAAFTVGISVLTTILSALAPALQASRPDPIRAMAEAQAGSPGRLSAKLTRNPFMVAQVALAVVISIGALLFLRTIRQLQTDLGYVPERVVMFSMKPVRDGNVLYTDSQLRRLFADLMRRVEELPGVVATSMTAGSLGTFNRQAGVVRIERDDQTTTMLSLRSDEVSPGSGFLSTMKLSMVRGRTFNERDHLGPPVVIVTDSLARDLFGDANSLGRRVKIGGAAAYAEIIGIVSSGIADPRRDPSMRRFLFVPLGQGGLPSICTLLVRADSLRPGDLIAAVRNQSRMLDKDLPVFNIRTASAELDQVLSRERLVAALSSLFGTVALFLVAIGLYGVVSHSVIRRRKEIGIRMALGAGSVAVLRQVVSDTLRVALAGIVVGLPTAYAVGRFVSSELYGTSPFDPATFGTCIVIILAVATIASLLPAKRAASVDPLIALRQE